MRPVALMQHLRQCVACRQFFERAELIRVVHNRQTGQFNVLGQGSVQPVVSGRSAYLCPSPTCLKMALKGKKMQKALKTFIPDAILGYLENTVKGQNDVEQPH